MEVEVGWKFWICVKRVSAWGGVENLCFLLSVWSYTVTYDYSGKLICDFIEDMDCESGTITLQKPSEGIWNSVKLMHSNWNFIIGATFDVWCGCYTSQVDQRALLACVALEGYHSIATYAWFLGAETLHEHTPLLYTDRVGMYKCLVTCESDTCSKTFQLTCVFCRSN